MLDIPYMDHLATLHKFTIDFDRLFFDGKAVISGFDFPEITMEITIRFL